MVSPHRAGASEAIAACCRYVCKPAHPITGAQCPRPEPQGTTLKIELGGAKLHHSPEHCASLADTGREEDGKCMNGAVMLVLRVSGTNFHGYAGGF